MSLAIPGCTRLFHIFQVAFWHEDKSRNWLRISPTVYGLLDDFWWLAKDLVSRPTRIAEIIPDCHPATNGTCDAAASGMGGVNAVPTDTKEIPILWGQQFPGWICCDLPLFTNPTGPITNNDFKLVGSIAHSDILAQAADVCEKITHNLYDKIVVVFW